MAFREVPFERFVTSCSYHRPFQNPVESVEKEKGRRGDHSESTRAWKHMDCIESNKNPLGDRLSCVMALGLSEERELVFMT